MILFALSSLIRKSATRLWHVMGRTGDYWITRFLILRMTGLVYSMAFLILVNQGIPLVGQEGLLPAPDYISRIVEQYSGPLEAFVHKPTIFLGFYSDTFFLTLAWIGLVLSVLILLGLDNAVLLGTVWFLYLSFVHVGQIWYGYGWEMQLLETGFLAIFLTSFLDPRPFSKPAPPVPVIWLYHWLTFRVMMGSGLIKLRGDSCWWNLTCLQFHFETQPLPNPLSWYFHYLPDVILQGGVLFNHVAEVLAPFGVFVPGLTRLLSGGIMALFQVTLIFSGNLSFLNWLTLIPILACFRDRHFRKLIPSTFFDWLEKGLPTKQVIPRVHKIKVTLLTILVLTLSVNPVINLLSPNQIMNTSFTPLNIVNSYGAFGSVGRRRTELVVKGTRSFNLNERTNWKTYRFKGKPTDPSRVPPWISPYHYRLDWQIWFAAMKSPRRTPWIFRFVQQLLENDPAATSLLRDNPFPGQGPRYVKIDRYLYQFTTPSSNTSDTWKRRKVSNWLPPISMDNPQFQRLLKRRGWLSD